MDVPRASKMLRLFPLMLAFAAVRSVAADEGFVEVGDQSSTIVFASSDDLGIGFSTTTDIGTELVVHASDGPIATASAGAPTAARGTLSVVANGQRTPRSAAILRDPAVQPAAARANVSASQKRQASSNNRYSGVRRRPVPNSQMVSRQAQGPKSKLSVVTAKNASARSQPTAKRRPTRQTPAMALDRGREQSPRGRVAPSAPQQRSTQAAKTNSPKSVPVTGPDLLVQAYQLSTTAASESDFSQIVRWCADAMRQGLEGENRDFALQLSSWSLNRRGQIRADQGQREIALADFRAALEFDPKCWRALHNRGVTLAQSGQFAEAFDDMSKVIELNPQFAKAYSNRATLYVQAGGFEHAVADYDSALNIDRTLLQAHMGRGRVCHMMGALDKALESMNAAIELDGTNAEIICSRGDLLVDLARYEEALEDYAKAIDLNPKFEHAYRNGAWLLATCPDDAIRDVDGALTGAQAALECGYGERHAALDTMAAALANAGRFEEAVGTLQQAIEIAPPEAVSAYQARQQLYESGQPFRTYPVEDPVQAAEFVEG